MSVLFYLEGLWGGAGSIIIRTQFVFKYTCILGASVVAQRVKCLPAVGDPGSIPGSGRSPGEGHGNPTPVFLLEESHGWRRLVGYIYSPWRRRELDTTEQLHYTCI